jgi:hypothetical protein
MGYLLLRSTRELGRHLKAKTDKKGKKGQQGLEHSFRPSCPSCPFLPEHRLNQSAYQGE